MQRNQKKITELIRKAKKLIRDIEREEAKISPDPSDGKLLEALFKPKDTTQHHC